MEEVQPVPSPYKRHDKKATVRIYGPRENMNGFEDVPGDVCALMLPNGAVAQLSRLAGRTDYPDGYLVRVWPANGTSENGGTNLEVLSAVVYCPDELLDCHVNHLSVSKPAPFWAEKRP